MDKDVPPEVAYETMGFSRWDGESPAVQAPLWRALQKSQRLEEVRRRTLIQRDQAGCPIVDAGYIVGHIPPLNLEAPLVEKLLFTLTEGLARGLETTDELRSKKG